MGIEAGKLRQEKPGRRPGLTCYLNITKKPIIRVSRQLQPTK